jgi:hypothetical protein
MDVVQNPGGTGGPQPSLSQLVGASSGAQGDSQAAMAGGVDTKFQLEDKREFLHSFLGFYLSSHPFL